MVRFTEALIRIEKRFKNEFDRVKKGHFVVWGGVAIAPKLQRAILLSESY